MPSFGQLLARLSDLFGVGIGAVPFANRNLFVDGAFDQWTAASATIANTYTAATMWMGYGGLNGVAALGQVDMRATPASNFMFESPIRYSFNFQQTTASTGTIAARNTPTLYQRIEGAQTASGRSVTFSLKLYVTSGTLNITSILLQQYFGTGGSPSATVIFDKTVNWNLTTKPTKFSVRIDVPSTSGKTFGTSGGDYLGVGIWFPPGVTFSVVGLEAQLELSNPNSSSDINGNGGAPTAFEYRGVQLEWQRVARYYQNMPNAAYWCGTTTSGWNYSLQANFVQPMRIAPAFSFVASGSFSQFPGGTPPTFIASTNMMVQAYLTANGTSTLGTFGYGFTADARL